MSNAPNSHTPAGWPHCPALDATCLMVDCVESMGESVLDTLMAFVRGAEDGSRLILQRNRDGFTVQVTGAVQKGHTGTQMDIDDLRALRTRLDQIHARGTLS